MKLFKRIFATLISLGLFLMLITPILGLVVTYDCDCEDVHIHTASNTQSCFPLNCTKTHTHTKDCYNMLVDPICGVPYKPHKLSCLSEASLEQQTKFTADSTTVPAKAKPHGPYVFCERHTYQSGHTFYSTLTGDDTLGQLFFITDFEGLNPGDTWSPSPLNVRYDARSGVDYNYFVSYCSDADTDAVQWTMYRLINLENSVYYGQPESQCIRSIMLFSYPYRTLAEVQKDLYAAGIECANDLGESEIIAATQLAIWEYSNGETNPFALNNVKYWKTKYSKRMTGITANVNSDSNQYQYYSDIDANVKEVARYLMSYAQANPVSAEPDQVIVSDITIDDLAVMTNGSGYDVELTVKLNSGYVPKDETTGITLVVTSGSSSVTIDVDARTEYTVVLPNYELGSDITIEMAGNQEVDTGVFFLQPYSEHAEDRRDVSQNMVAITSGVIPVGEVVTLNPVTLKLTKLGYNDAKLANVEFSLYYEGSEKVLVDTFTTDENGVVTCSNLLSGGVYSLVENKTLDGYQLLDEAIRFEVVDASKNYIKLLNTVEGVTVDNDGLSLTIENHQFINVKLEATKVMENGTTSGFTFEVVDAKDKVVSKGSSNEEGKVTFEPITFTETGTYTYKVKEIEDLDKYPNVVFSKTIYDVTVVVARNDAGSLVVEDITYKVNETLEDAMVFENALIPSVEVTLQGTKVFDNHALDGFVFVLKDEKGVLQEAESNESGVFTFGPLQYSEPNVYKYTIHEKEGTDTSIVYDERIYDVIVTVTRENDSLQASVEYKLNGNVVNEVVFENELLPPPPPTADASGANLMFGALLSSLLLVTFVVLRKKN